MHASLQRCAWTAVRCSAFHDRRSVAVLDAIAWHVVVSVFWILRSYVIVCHNHGFFRAWFFGMSSSKRRRLDGPALANEQSALVDLRAKLPYISQSALAAILKIAEREPLPRVTSAKAVRASRDSHLATRTLYGAVHQWIPDAAGNWFDVQHPFAMLWSACKTSPAMSSLIQRLPASSPVRPLSIIFYADEIAPGKILALETGTARIPYILCALVSGSTWLCHRGSFEDRSLDKDNVFHEKDLVMVSSTSNS